MENEKQVVITEADYIAEWRSMLQVFENIIEKKPTPEKVKSDLQALSEAACLTVRLTPRQKAGIVDRCANYINGTYGTNKTKTEYMNNLPKTSQS